MDTFANVLVAILAVSGTVLVVFLVGLVIYCFMQMVGSFK